MDKMKEADMRRDESGIVVKERCNRCNGRLSTNEGFAPVAFKGGYSGFFCDTCMNSWNKVYHTSPFCLMLRKADLKLAAVRIVAKGNGIDQLEKVERAIDEATSYLNDAMKGLFYLAKDWVVSYKPPTESFKESLDKAHDANVVLSMEQDTSMKAAYISPITGKEV